MTGCLSRKCCSTTTAVTTLISLWCSKEGCPNPQSALTPRTFHSRFPEEQAPEKRENRKSPEKINRETRLQRKRLYGTAMGAAHRTRVPMRGFMRQSNFERRGALVSRRGLPWQESCGTGAERLPVVSFNS